MPWQAMWQTTYGYHTSVTHNAAEEEEEEASYWSSECTSTEQTLVHLPGGSRTTSYLLIHHARASRVVFYQEGNLCSVFILELDSVCETRRK